jgi:hypothetical protein
MPDTSRDPMLQRQKPTDAELDALSQITPADIDAAVAAFNQYAPPNAKGLLDAKPDNGK